MADYLTQNQERYVQELVKGKTQRQAYLIAYPKSKNWKEKTVDENASRLFNNRKAQARYNELMNKHKDKAIMTRDELLRGLKKAFEMACGIEPTKTVIKELVGGEAQTIVNRISLQVDLKSIASLSHQIAKLEGWEIDKVEHSGKLETTETKTIIHKIDEYEELFNGLHNSKTKSDITSDSPRK